LTTTYKILFTIELQNEYYSNLQCKDFTVIPSEETVRLLKNRQMMYKLVGNRIVVLVKVKTDAPDENKPVVDIDPADRFLFYMGLNNSQFSTITNLDDDNLRERKLFYFTNLYQNDLAATLNLTQKIVKAVAPADFKPGDLTADIGGNVYECIKKTTIATPPPDPGFWYNRSIQQYASSRDMVPFVTRIRAYTTTSLAKKFEIKVFGLNRATNLYDLPLTIKNNVVTSDADTKNIQVDLSELAAGRYRIQVNADEYDLYIDDAAVYNGAFGVIEIFSHFANGTPFSLLDATGKVKDTVVAMVGQWLQYKIKFANRMAYWKYVTLRHDVTAIDGGPAFTFTPTPGGPGPKDFFISNKPVPLTETPVEFSFTLSSAVFSEPPLVPNPDPTVTGMLSRTLTEKDYYCTINLNY
jgi:hypothetical protein